MKKLFLVVVVMALAACTSEDPDNSSVGNANAALEEGVRLQMIYEAGQDDVTAFNVLIRHDEEFVVSDCVPLEQEMLPTAFLPDGSGEDHRFADQFFVLAASKLPYQITAVPVRSCDPLEVSEYCAEATGEAVIAENETTEVVLMSQCDMPDSGALDTIVGLNHDPVILDFDYNDSKFIRTCESMIMTVTAHDQDGDQMSYEWTITPPDSDALYESTVSGDVVEFMSYTAGTYLGSVQVCDNYGQCAHLNFPIYVTMSNDVNENDIGDECDGFEIVVTLDGDFDEGSLLNVVTANDALELSSEVSAFDFIWVAVSSRGTVVKIDTTTGDILGEYRTAPTGYGLNPSRTTVDQNGSAWVTNRDECGGQMGSAVKFGLLENPGECEDRNGDGVITTSSGLGDVLAWTGSDVTGAVDECIVIFARTTSCGTRHVSVDADNNVWMSGTGGTNARSFDLIDGNTGAILRTEPGNGHGGYGGLIAPDGGLWSARPLMYVADPSLSFSASGNRINYGHDSYGLCVNQSNGEVWNTQLYGGVINRFSSAGALIGTYSHGSGSAQGCVVDRDGHVWVAHSLLGSTVTVGHLAPDGTHLGNVTLDDTRVGATGVAVDGNGYIWATGYHTGIVYRIDPDAGPAGSDGVTPVGQVDMESTPGGNLYNYSDMTGSTLIGAPGSGSWTASFDSGEAGTVWTEIAWDAVTPGDSSIAVTMSVSDDGSSWSAPAPVTNGSDPAMSGQYVQIVVSFMRSSTGETPTLEEIRLTGF